MHRAYLLASVGIRNIPTVIVDESILSPIATMYPAFNSQALEAERPPVIMDMLA